jgi:L-2,4-diaminobutyrate decarboxylase
MSSPALGAYALASWHPVVSLPTILTAMTPLLERALDPETFRQQGHALIDQLADFLQQSASASPGQVQPWQPPEAMLAVWQADAEELGQGDLGSFFAKLLANSINVHHPNYMGHQVAAPLPAAALANLLTALLNNGMAVYEMGASATALERVVVGILAKALGYPTGADGLLTSGGTLANLTALLSARAQRARTGVWEEGTHAQYAVMVSEEAHYCVERAVRVMGWGAAGIVKVPVNDQYQLRTDLLETYYQQALAEGKEVLAVVGSASSTSTGAYDDLAAIGAFCQAHQLWFHVDGAHGGAVVFSEKYKHLAHGIALADSVVIDFHKMLLTPALATALVFRRADDSYATFAQKAQYLWAQADREWFNLAKRTFECTKLMISVRVYALMRVHGLRVFDDYVTTMYDLGRQFAHLIGQRPDFELAVAPAANIVCFRYVLPGHSPQEADALNLAIRQSLLEAGEFYIVQTSLRGRVYLRTTLMNPRTTEAELGKLLDRVAYTALAVGFPQMA